ncbi:hypothetical protein QF028_002087 [Neobacillus sp. B4I6]|uniref:DUF5659 domain-containing protein n=1 Tax=Neobacillus sp. B4I6 TaxID=3373925 RepID=UPI003D261DF6
MNREKDFVVFSQRMAGFLMMNGCGLKKIKNDINIPTKFVYYFPNTDYVKNFVEQYLNKSNKRRDKVEQRI